MAIINCPECNKEVSDKAVSCPNCGCPILDSPVSQPIVDRSTEFDKYIDLAVKAIQGQNSDQVEKYCELALEINPKSSRAWELEARGILFGSTLKSNKIPQAIGAAANAVNNCEEDKEELAISLYRAICTHISGLLSIAINRMPVAYAPQYVAQCMGYYGEVLSGIPCIPEKTLQAELAVFDKLDNDSKKAIMPRKRMIYASHATKPSWANQYRAILKTKGIL